MKKLLKFFPKAPTSGPTIKKFCSCSIYNVKVIGSQEQTKLLNDEEAKKEKKREKLNQNKKMILIY